MNRLFCLGAALLCVGPSQSFAQRSQESTVDFGAPIVDRAAQGELNLTLGRKMMLEQIN